MFSLLFWGFIFFLGAVFIFKVFFFILKVLLAGTGFLIISIVGILLLVPILPFLFIFLGGFLSFSTIMIITIIAVLVSFVSSNEKSNFSKNDKGNYRSNENKYYN